MYGTEDFSVQAVVGTESASLILDSRIRNEGMKEIRNEGMKEYPGFLSKNIGCLIDQKAFDLLIRYWLYKKFNGFGIVDIFMKCQLLPE